jgi:hypothetical protein
VIDDEASSLDHNDAFADIFDAFTRQEVTIMTTTAETVHRSFASLKLPDKVPALITYAHRIIKAMTGNPAFPSPTPTLAAVTEAINERTADDFPRMPPGLP